MSSSSPSPLRFHWLRLRATAHPTEIPERVIAAMQCLTAMEDPPEAEATELDTHHGATSLLLDMQVTRARDIRNAIALLLPDRARLLEEVEARTDEDGVFYLRFDKQRALQGRAVLCRHDDSIQVRLKPEVHPTGRDRALAALQAWLQD